MQKCRYGWFLFLDVDYFKKINDTCGHAVGDEVLRKVALILKDIFYDCGITGRMGGDEFAVMIDKKDISENEMQAALNRFFKRNFGHAEGLL